jgi:hypothetical protein
MTVMTAIDVLYQRLMIFDDVRGALDGLTTGKRPGALRENLREYRFLHYKSQINLTGLEPRPSPLEADT